MTEAVLKQISDSLARPFEPEEVKWKPQVVSGTRALAIAYVDARVVEDRLDETVGTLGWQDSYEVLPDGNVVCKLSLRLGSEWVVKSDVGGPSEQPDGGDRMKAAFSDALKRAAVKFGIGRYLYRLPQQWVDYDPQKRQLVRMPTLPQWAIPGKSPAAASKPVAVKEPARKITEAQLQQIDALLLALKSSYGSLAEGLRKHGVSRVEDLTEADAAKLIQTLNAILDAKKQPAEAN